MNKSHSFFAYSWCQISVSILNVIVRRYMIFYNIYVMKYLCRICPPIQLTAHREQITAYSEKFFFEKFLPLPSDEFVYFNLIWLPLLPFHYISSYIVILLLSHFSFKIDLSHTLLPQKLWTPKNIRGVIQT
jgi:hypothetical protein